MNVLPLPFRPENADATAYVATQPEEGLGQLALLIEAGCQPHHRVLEIGCGALVAGFPIMQYLEEGNYCGIEPNYWLTFASLKVEEVQRVAADKKPLFAPRSDFRSDPPTKFNFIIAHSILSHASDAQLTDFLVAAAEQLTDDGILLASIRLAEGNEFGSPGSTKHGAAFTEWQYPGVSWFRRDDVIERARKLGLCARVEPEMTKTITTGNPKAVHDWIEVRRTKVTLVTGFFRLPDRAVDEDEQFRRFYELAECGLPIILFLDERLAPGKEWPSNVIEVEHMRLEELRPFERAGDRPLAYPALRDNAKDTRSFLLLQNAKLDMLLRAELLDETSTHFAWIDFGVTKISENPSSFTARLHNLRPPTKCVLAPGCWTLDESENTSGHAVNWRFCGGFLLADRHSMVELARSHRSVFDRHLNLKALTWEVNVWAEMERTGTHFDWYKADHDDSIIDFERAIAWREPVTMKTIHGERPRICLNMIVKNESAIIERCLTAALPFIDTWCIADTGSTDGTPARIESFFDKHGIPGKLIRSKFENFAQARNEALNAARSMRAGWDYALLIDADMVIQGAFEPQLNAPAYTLVQRADGLAYRNTRLVRRDVPSTYVGVTHEFLSVEGVLDLEATFFIDDRNDGGSKSDKGERDIRLLEEGLRKEPNNERYMFYLAQTYREMDRPHRAVPWYVKRIAAGGWDEEIWASHYGLARCYRELGDEKEFICAALMAHSFRPFRGEPLKLLAQHFRERGHNETALIFAFHLDRLKMTGDKLFVETPVYDRGAAEEIAIAGFYSRDKDVRRIAYNQCAKLTVHPNAAVRELMRNNFTYYAKSAKELFGAETRRIDWIPSNGWAPMNPSVLVDEDGNRRVLVRTVNYKVANGEYPTIDGSGIIRTANYLLEMGADWSTIKSTPIGEKTGRSIGTFPVEGFEDCRLWESETSLYVSATVRDAADSDGRCEMATIRIDDDGNACSFTPIRDYERNKTQKNWMPITGNPGSFLYSCDPTIAIETWSNDQSTHEIKRHKPSVCLADLRGGSQLIPWGAHGSWLCITHEVSWRPERVYLHRFVYFGPNFQILGITEPFYFEHVGIEFCAGLARDGDRLVASFGVNDASAHLAFFDPERLSESIRDLW